MDPRKLWPRQLRVNFTTRAKFVAKAIEQIVDAYVRYSNRRAIDELKRHRQKILLDIRMRSRDYDWSLLTSTIEEELAVINAGLDRLQP